MSDEELFEQEKEPVSDTKTYAIFYNDNSYVTYDLTEKDYQGLKHSLLFHLPVIEVSIGLLRTGDIRSVIVQRPIQENKAVDPLLSDEQILWMNKIRQSEEMGEWLNDSEG